MTPAEEAADRLGRTSRELAEAIAQLPKCIGQLDQELMKKRIKTLRAARDAAAAAYRAAATGEGA